MGYINDLVHNQGQTTEECLEVVGDLNKVYAFANFWDEHADLLHIIAVDEFITWTEGEFNAEEKQAFEEGLAKFPQFFEKCFQEMKRREKEIS